MILILTDSGDLTTLNVVKWLEQLDKKVLLITDEDTIQKVNLDNDNFLIEFSSGKLLDFGQLDAYWYRRGGFDFSFQPKYDCPAAINNHLENEMRLIKELLDKRLLQIPHLNSDLNSEINRLIVLDQAKTFGFAVPKWSVLNHKKEVRSFFHKFGKLVTKPIGNGIFLNEDNIFYGQYTSLFTEEDVNKLPESFIPSLFAQYIEKKYELRIFYLAGICFTMAILSQLDPQTAIDMRHYNYQKPNRNLPYQLPVAIAKKIDVLMQVLKLESGSIDMIVTPTDDFLFLEVNPIGQFGNVSSNCNYYLEQKVAQHLAQLSA